MSALIAVHDFETIDTWHRQKPMSAYTVRRTHQTEFCLDPHSSASAFLPCDTSSDVIERHLPRCTQHTMSAKQRNYNEIYMSIVILKFNSLNVSIVTRVDSMRTSMHKWQTALNIITYYQQFGWDFLHPSHPRHRASNTQSRKRLQFEDLQMCSAHICSASYVTHSPWSVEQLVIHSMICFDMFNEHLCLLFPLSKHCDFELLFIIKENRISSGDVHPTEWEC